MLKFNVVGVTFEERQYVISKMDWRDAVLLVKDDGNKYDENAIKVMRREGQQSACIGFVPRELCGVVREFMVDNDVILCPNWRRMGGGFVNGVSINYGVQITIFEIDDREVLGVELPQ